MDGWTDGTVIVIVIPLLPYTLLLLYICQPDRGQGLIFQFSKIIRTDGRLTKKRLRAENPPHPSPTLLLIRIYHATHEQTVDKNQAPRIAKRIPPKNDFIERPAPPPPLAEKGREDIRIRDKTTPPQRKLKSMPRKAP